MPLYFRSDRRPPEKIFKTGFLPPIMTEAAYNKHSFFKEDFSNYQLFREAGIKSMAGLLGAKACVGVNPPLIFSCVSITFDKPAF